MIIEIKQPWNKSIDTCCVALFWAVDFISTFLYQSGYIILPILLSLIHALYSVKTIYNTNILNGFSRKESMKLAAEGLPRLTEA